MPFFDQPGQPREHKPWPMKWIVLSILAFIVLYTLIMVKFRKPGPSYEPYQDTVDRVTVERLLSSGYQRFNASVQVPADSVRSLVLGASRPARIHAAPGGIPSEINVDLIQKPTLAESIDSVLAAQSGRTRGTYRILFTATLPDHRHAATSATVFRRGNKLTILPNWDPVGGRLETRWRSSVVLVDVPTDSLPAGTYDVSIVGGHTSRAWTLDLRQ